ncbi:MAG TPA: hypothetical protein VKD21_10085 [Acidimicrobiales bacterium]|nr:hypothetical protein [Acidimicrobiales bacterium]
MHSFVVVAAKPGRRVPVHVSEYLARPDVPDVAFAPDGHLHWTTAGETAAFAGWQSTSDVLEIGSHWHLSDLGLTAFSGRPWPRERAFPPGMSWAEGLASLWPLGRSGHPPLQLGGVFAAVSLSEGGRGSVATDPLSVAVLYRSETDDCVAFASSPALAARVAAEPDAEPDRDPLCSAWLTWLGWLVGDRTGFTAVRALPIGARVQLDPAYGSRVVGADSTPWVDADGQLDDTVELIDAVHADLTSSMRSIAQLPSRRKLADITGGRDSRLVLALILQEGLSGAFDFRTTGADVAPDSIVGREIAKVFHLSHESVVPGAMDDADFERRLRAHAFHTSGMINAWDFKGSITPGRAPRLSGLFGETLSTNFKEYPELHTNDDLRRVFHRMAKLDTGSILLPDVRRSLTRDLDAELIERIDSGGSAPQDRLDSFYIRNRLRRWLGTMEEIGESGRIFPLYSLTGVRVAFAMGSNARRAEQLHFSIIRKACPELARLPLANRAWSDAVLSKAADGDECRTAPITYSGPAAVQWQAQRIEDNGDLVRGYLLDEPSSPLFDMVDRRALVTLLETGPPWNPQQARQIFGALTAAVWLGHHDSRSKVGGAWDTSPHAPPCRAPRRGRLDPAAEGDAGHQGRRHRWRLRRWRR